MAVDFSSSFVIVFTVGTILTFILNHIMECADFFARKKNGGKLPKELLDIDGAKEYFTDEKLEKIVRYENAKYFLWIPSSICSIVLLFLLVFLGFYPWVFKIACMVTGIPHGFWSLFFCYLIFSVLSDIPDSILSLPFDLYEEFSIEKRFGFSNMTFKMWVIDAIKSFFVSLIPALILSILISLAFTFFENTWWLIMSVVLIAFVLVMQVVYPKFIAPLFNKFEPLPEGELKEKLCALLEKTGFKNGGLFIMDESKRSKHSNAYFSGFGKNKRIVLYDTLVNQLSSDELVAVLAHELGHFKLKHTTRTLIISIPLIFVSSFLLYKFSQFENLYTSFGFDISSVDLKWIKFIGLFLVSIIWNSVSEILTPIGNISSRRHEYQADKFAKEICGNSINLCTALLKLNSENLSELFPPPFYVWWNYSHPTLVQRVKVLREDSK